MMIPAWRFPLPVRLFAAAMVSLGLHLVALDLVASGVARQSAPPGAVMQAQLAAVRQSIARPPEAGWLAAVSPKSDLPSSMPTESRPEQGGGMVALASAEIFPSYGELATAVSHETTVEDPIFYPARTLGRSPIPISAPNPRRYLKGVDAVPGVIRVRLYIDALGRVVRVDASSGGMDDDPTFLALRQMLQATTFIPGNLAGQDVASYLDIELELADL